MPKETIIPAGYRLTVTTWENDGDHYKTKVLEGLTKERVTALVELSKLFSSKNNGGAAKGYIGNMYDPNDAERSRAKRAIDRVLKKYPGEFPPIDDADVDDEDTDINDGVWDLIYELGLAGGDFYTRVMETFKVEYMPVEVRLNDVTEDFK